MIRQGAALPTILIAAFLINLRHLVMSSSVMQRMKGTTLPQRLTGAFALCDESFALYSLSSDGSYSFLLGSNSALYASFVGSTIIGCLVTSVLPQIVIDSFGIAFYAAFLGMLLPVIRRHARLMFLVLITAGSNWLLQLFLPASWSVIIAMILGALIGVWIVDDGTLRETRGGAV